MVDLFERCKIDKIYRALWIEKSLTKDYVRKTVHSAQALCTVPGGSVPLGDVQGRAKVTVQVARQHTQEVREMKEREK